MPKMFPASVTASSADRASLTPPAFPRPPRMYLGLHHSRLLCLASKLGDGTRVLFPGTRLRRERNRDAKFSLQDCFRLILMNLHSRSICLSCARTVLEFTPHKATQCTWNIPDEQDGSRR